MNAEEIRYVKWILGEINAALALNPFTSDVYTPMEIGDVFGNDGKVTHPTRLVVAAEIYKTVMGGKWRLLDLEKMLKDQKVHLLISQKRIKDDIKYLMNNQVILNHDVLKLCLILTGLDEHIINGPKYVVQRKFFHTGNPNKLWSSIGYYDIKNRSIHVSTGAAARGKRVRFPIEHIIETASHELGHHIYISIMTGRFRVARAYIGNIRKLLRGVRISRAKSEHEQQVRFYTKDYGNEWNKNKAIQIMPKASFVRYGLENETFAQAISGNARITKQRRKQLILLLNNALA